MDLGLHTRSAHYADVLIYHILGGNKDIRDACLDQVAEQYTIRLPGNIYALCLTILPLLYVVSDLLSQAVVDLIDEFRSRPCGIKALDQIRPEMDRHAELLRSLHALSQRHDIIFMTESYDFPDKMLFLGPVLDLADQGSVYLHIIRHISEEIADI